MSDKLNLYKELAAKDLLTDNEKVLLDVLANEFEIKEYLKFENARFYVTDTKNRKNVKIVNFETLEEFLDWVKDEDMPIIIKADEKGRFTLEIYNDYRE